MKAFILLFGTFMIFCLNSCSQDFKKLKDSEIDTKKVQIAQNFANEYLTEAKNGSWFQFKDETTDALKNLLTEETQKSVYKQLKDLYGDFQNFEYAETWFQTGSSPLIIFRFKGNFEKSNKKLEIRVVLDESNKVAGFWIRPWSDMFN